MVTLFIKLKKRYENYLVQKAIKKANKYFQATGNRFLVVWYDGKPLVKSKQELRKLIKQGYFKKGLTIQKIEKTALYSTR